MGSKAVPGFKQLDFEETSERPLYFTIRIRSLARALGEDHSRVTRVLALLALPPEVFAVLRVRSGDHRIRAHFTEKRLRAYLREGIGTRRILQEIDRVASGVGCGE